VGGAVVTVDIRVSFPDEVINAIADAVAVRLQLNAPAESNGGFRVLTLAEVSEALGRSERTVRKWIATGELPRVQLGAGGFRFLEVDVRAFCERRRVAAGGAAR
jgi:excisionase family DNA binding protein